MCSSSRSRPKRSSTRSSGRRRRRCRGRTLPCRCAPSADSPGRGAGVHYGGLSDSPALAMMSVSAVAEPTSESSGRPKENPMAAKLYVGGLSYSTTSETLREYFAQCGTVESASVVTDKFSGQSRGFGFVEMATAEEAQRAISELNGKELDGRKLTVNVSNPRPAGGAGGGGGRGPGGRGPGRPGGGGGRGPGGDRAVYGVPPSKKPFRW